MDASEIFSKRLNAKEVIFPKQGEFIFPIADGRIKPLGGARSENIHLDAEHHRRDQQLLHEQLLQQNWDLREAHEKSLKEIEELKKFQSSTFDTTARRRLVEDQNTIFWDFLAEHRNCQMK